MNTFLKYEFLPSEWANLKKLIEQTSTTPEGDITTYKDCAVVEIGFICLEWGQVDDKPVCTKQSDKWAVDILFYTEPPIEFKPFEVYPNPCGVHTFSGDESLYLKTFCDKFPDSPYCIIPDTI
jgi:hypothetical protein